MTDWKCTHIIVSGPDRIRVMYQNHEPGESPRSDNFCFYTKSEWEDKEPSPLFRWKDGSLHYRGESIDCKILAVYEHRGCELTIERNSDSLIITYDDMLKIDTKLFKQFDSPRGAIVQLLDGFYRANSTELNKTNLYEEFGLFNIPE